MRAGKSCIRGSRPWGLEVSRLPPGEPGPRVEVVRTALEAGEGQGQPCAQGTWCAGAGEALGGFRGWPGSAYSLGKANLGGRCSEVGEAPDPSLHGHTVGSQSWCQAGLRPCGP